MSAITYQTDDQGIVTLTIDMPGQATNTMTQVFREAYGAAVQRLEVERDQIAGVILTSGKSTFFAGGDLKSLLTANDAAAMFQRAETTKALMRRLEKLGKPVVAAINGTALGGGLELCLACHARFALDDEKIQLGLPETSLGLIPGAGGVARLTRLLGVQAATQLIVDGTLFNPRRALQMKLVNALAVDRDALLAQCREWILANPAAQQPWDQKGFRFPGACADAPADLTWLRTAPTLLLKKHRGLYPALEAAMSCAVEGAAVDFDTASRIESRYLANMAVHPVAKNLIRTFFFQMNEVKSGKSRPESVPPAQFKRVGILGVGLMGQGIAQVAAERGIVAVLKDMNLEKAEQGKAKVQQNLAKQVEKKRLTPEKMAAMLQAIVPAGDADGLKGCDLIIEAVFENREVKRKATQEAEPQLAAGGIFASNTSTLPISGLAEASARPENFIGLHFFSPVERMALVEIIKGKKTSAETLARAYDFVLQLGKTPIVVNDSRGFFTSRVFGTFTREGAAMLAEGVDPALIENAAIAAGLPVGPLAVMDETSMALAWSVREQTIKDLRAEGKPIPEHPAWAVIGKMVNELNRPGRAGGGGYYDYPQGGGKKQLWPGLAQHFQRAAQPLPGEDIRDRFLFIQALESVRCLEEGVIEHPRDGNIGATLGIGYPRWTGGPLQFIDMMGAKAFARRASELASRYGERFAPPKRLAHMAETRQTFSA
jgi:3-hydroxyacyl-CoA dehydrogenase/enoyl-CoA hydratase/3-hydroxybutyryl-CoA epimerase